MKEAVASFISAGGDFGSLAMNLYQWQRSHNPEYDRFCGTALPQDWRDIPAVPTTLFRDLSLTCFPAEEAEAVFHTSGTTTGRPGRIHLKDTELYDLAARAHAESVLGALPGCGVSLVSEQAEVRVGYARG